MINEAVQGDERAPPLALLPLQGGEGDTDWTETAFAAQACKATESLPA